MGDAVVAESQGEAGVNDVTEPGGGLGGPVPERFGYFRFVVAEFPNRIDAKSIAKVGGFPGCLRLFEDCGVAELHVKFNQNQAAEEKALFAARFFLKEPAGTVMMR
jgi:hypothetical protein